MVCGYIALNKITIADVIAIPLNNETIDQVAGSNACSHIDLIWGSHQTIL